MLRELTRPLRTLRRDRSFTLLVILVLGLGIGSTTTLFSVLDSVLWRPLPFDGSDRLVSVLEGEPGEHAPTSPAVYSSVVAGSRTLVDVTATYLWNPVLRGTGHPTEVRGLATTAGLFDLLRSRAKLGGTFDAGLERLPESDAQVVVLGHALWQRVFGADPAILGNTISLDGEAHTVVAIMPPDFAFPTFWAEGAELWAPFRLSPEQVGSHSRFLRVFARLRDGTTLDRAQAEMNVLAQRLEAESPRANADLQFQVSPLLESTVGDTRTALWVMFVMVGLVLFVACANVASLFFARALRRKSDFAVRRALGASRARSAAQFVGESLWLAVLGGLFGLVLCIWSLDAVVAWGPADLPRLGEIEMEPRAVLYTLGLSLVSGMIFGSVPVFAQGRWHLRESLRPSGAAGVGTGDRLRKALVVVEVACTVVLLAGAGTMIRSFQHLTQFDPGFDRHNLLTLQLSLRGTDYEEPAAQWRFFDALLQAANAEPGVLNAGLINHLPVGDDIWTHSFRIVGQPEPAPSETPSATLRVASAELFETLGIELIAGRGFEASDHAHAPRVAMVNDTLAQQYFPGTEAVGQRFRQGSSDEEWTVIGVVHDFRQFRLTDDVRPEMIFPYTQSPLGSWPKSSLVVRTDLDPMALAPALQDRLWRLAPELSISNVRSMASLLDGTVAESRFQALALTIFATVALILSAVGLYGVMSYLVAWRGPDIGVRMAVGADRRDILRWIFADGLGLVGVGLTLGLGAAWTARRALESLVHGVEAADWVTLTGSGLVLMVVAFVAIGRPALRAARLDPVTCLRGE
ncbi:MAG: ABC transporter permease [Thermoanaerobaculia bacterium]|nr:ABC transporter permease [Thermoanaerobaculia bacterium]